MVRIASATGVPCATSTSTWRSLETISSGLCLFLPIVVILLRLRSHTSGWTTPRGADQMATSLRHISNSRSRLTGEPPHLRGVGSKHYPIHYAYEVIDSRRLAV